MEDNKKYFEFLKNRSVLGRLYRKIYLYPKLSRLLNGRMLDIGCGIGDMLAFRPNSVGVDVNPFNVAFCKAHGFDALEMPFDQLPFADNTFDSVLLDNVLEHISNPTPLFCEIRRVMRQDAVLLIGVPGLKGQSSDQDHKVFYDEAKLSALAVQLGFDVKCLTHTPLVKSKILSRYLRQYCIYTQWSMKASA